MRRGVRGTGEKLHSGSPPREIGNDIFVSYSSLGRPEIGREGYGPTAHGDGDGDGVAILHGALQP